MRKRGQAALDFLMTYGWVILSIVIVIGVFGIYLYESYKPIYTIAEVNLLVHTDVYKYCNDFCALNNESSGCVEFPCSNLLQETILDHMYYYNGEKLTQIMDYELTEDFLMNTIQCVDWGFDGENVCLESGFCFRYKCADYYVQVTEGNL